MITLKQDQHGLWDVPGFCELQAPEGQVVLDCAIFPHASKQIVFGRGLGVQALAKAVEKATSGVLVVVGASSSKAPGIHEALDSILKTTANTRIYQVQGHADHRAIHGGIEAVKRIQAEHVIVIGGGTTLDVGKSVAGLAKQEGGEEITAFQTGKKSIDPKKALSWIAVPTTSGTGSESTNNAVIELGEEKRSIRNIPPPSLIIADPAFTDSLPPASTIVALVDALVQSLEVLTHAAASPEVQALAVAAFLNLVQGLKAMEDSHASADQTSSAATGLKVSTQIRDVLCWGSLLMGIAFAHAGLGLPHGLVHFCKKFRLSHGHMVGILLIPGLEVQALHNPATALRLEKVERAFVRAENEDTLPLSFDDKASAAFNPSSSKLLGRLHHSISKVFPQVGLATSLREAGLSRTDLRWIAGQEHALGTSFGIPKRRATEDELLAVLEKAWNG